MSGVWDLFECFTTPQKLRLLKMTLHAKQLIAVLYCTLLYKLHIFKTILSTVVLTDNHSLFCFTKYEAFLSQVFLDVLRLQLRGEDRSMLSIIVVRDVARMMSCFRFDVFVHIHTFED